MIQFVVASGCIIIILIEAVSRCKRRRRRIKMCVDLILSLLSEQEEGKKTVARLLEM